MLTTREAILLKVESTYKTDATPSATNDAILVSAVNNANESLRMVDRPLIKANISTEKKIFAGTLKKLTFTAEIKGSGSLGVAPEIGQALRCCGLDETIVASTSVAYQPVTDGHESCTIYYYQDGRLNKLLGARGTVTLSAEAGGLGAASFEFTGHDGGLVDATFPTITYDSTVPAPVINASFSIDSYSSVINSLTIDAGNTIAAVSDMNDTFGFGEVRVTMRDPNGSIDPEAVLVATKDFDAAWKAGTEMALTTGIIGSTSGNRWKLDANVALRDISQGDRESIRTEDLTFGCHEVSGDDEWNIIFN
jgi:hypothetical protein